MFIEKNGKIPLLIVCGPTASGKTGVGIELAKIYDGEIVSADSMQIYRGMKIVTATPNEEEKQGIPHYLMEIKEPGEAFSVADYVSLAHKKIEEIISKGKLPIIVGGTGLYINSLIDNISFDEEQSSPEVRKELEMEMEEKGCHYMHHRLEEVDPEIAKKIHENNKIRVIRALEMYITTGRTYAENAELSRQKQSPYEVCMIGLDYEDRADLYERINKRVDIMVQNGMVDEAREVYLKGDLKTASQAIGFKEFIPYFENKITLEESLDKIKQFSRNYAKRQLTWFSRDARIFWVKSKKNDQVDKIVNKCKILVENSKIMCYNVK